MQWVLLPLAAAFLFAIGGIFDKFIVENKLPNAISYFFLQLFIAVLTWPIMASLIFGFQIPSPGSLLLILFAAITSNIGYVIYFWLVKNHDISSVGPLAQTKLLFAIPLAFVFLGEFHGFEALLLMLLIFVGAMLTTYSKGFSVRKLILDNRLLVVALAMSLSWALADLPIKYLVEEITPASFLTWRYILSGPVILLFALFLFKKEARETLRANIKRTIPFSVLAATIGFVGILALFTSYEFSYTIPSAVVLSQGMFVFVLALVLSRLRTKVIREKQPLLVYAIRLAGVILISSSIWFLINTNIAL